MIRTVLLAVCVFSLVCTKRLNADLASITASDSGWYDVNGYHDSGNKNYVASHNTPFIYYPIGYPIPSGTTPLRNYLAFDLSGVSGNIIGATLRLQNPVESWTTPPTYTIYDVTAPSNVVKSSQLVLNDPVGVGVFNDLGSGTSFGSILVDGSFSGGIAEISINSAGIAALNAAKGGDFVFGGSLSASFDEQFVFGFTHDGVFVRELVLQTASVPEPSSALLMIGASIAALRLRKHKKAS